MRRTWKPISILLLFFLLVTTVIIYSRISAIPIHATTTQATNPGPGKFGCIKCQHKPHAVIHAASITPNDYLYAVAGVSTNNAWAVGVGVNYTNGFDKTLIEHWNGQLWSTVPDSIPGAGGDLYGVTAISATDAWAVGDYYPTTTAYGQTLIEHWNGTVWSVIPSPNGGTADNYLFDVNALTTNDVWAVGIQNDVASLIEHWNGTSWSIVGGPNPGITMSNLGSVRAISANSVWALGYYSTTAGVTNTKSLAEYWNGSSWEVVISPNPGTSYNQMFGMAVISNDNIWSLGSASNTTGNQYLFEHWDGAIWSTVNSPGGGFVDGITSVPGTTKVWAVGNTDEVNGVETTITDYWSGTQWEMVSSPNASSANELTAVAAVSANDVWAVGGYHGTANGYYSTLILHWDGAAWKVVYSPSP